MLIIIQSILSFFGMMAWFFQENSSKSDIVEVLSRKCPCTRMAKSGFLTKLLVYTAMFIFMIDGYMLKYLGFDLIKIIEIMLSLLMVFLGYKVKKE